MVRILTLMLLVGLQLPVPFASAAGWQTALEQLKQKARSGDGRAQEVLAEMYAEGDGVPLDRAEAVLWAGMAAGQNRPRSTDLLGTLLFTETASLREKVRAADLWRQAARQDYTPAQYRLALVLSRGETGPPDPESAFHWMEKAARAGIVRAQYLLGVMYETGQGVERDDREAGHWYRQAALSGFAPAQDALGGLYLRGQGVLQDTGLAYFWFSLAAEQNHPQAVIHLRKLQQKKTGDLLPLLERAEGQLQTCLAQTALRCRFEPATWDDL